MAITLILAMLCVPSQGHAYNCSDFFLDIYEHKKKLVLIPLGLAIATELGQRFVIRKAITRLQTKNGKLEKKHLLEKRPNPDKIEEIKQNKRYITMLKALDTGASICKWAEIVLCGVVLCTIIDHAYNVKEVIDDNGTKIYYHKNAKIAYIRETKHTTNSDHAFTIRARIKGKTLTTTAKIKHGKKDIVFSFEPEIPETDVDHTDTLGQKLKVCTGFLTHITTKIKERATINKSTINNVCTQNMLAGSITNLSVDQ